MKPFLSAVPNQAAERRGRLGKGAMGSLFWSYRLDAGIVNVRNPIFQCKTASNGAIRNALIQGVFISSEK